MASGLQSIQASLKTAWHVGHSITFSIAAIWRD